MSRYYRYPEPTHWRPIGKRHQPRWCVLCTVERIYLRLGLIDVNDTSQYPITEENVVNESDYQLRVRCVCENHYPDCDCQQCEERWKFCPQCGEPL